MVYRTLKFSAEKARLIAAIINIPNTQFAPNESNEGYHNFEIKGATGAALRVHKVLGEEVFHRVFLVLLTQPDRVF